MDALWEQALKPKADEYHSLANLFYSSLTDTLPYCFSAKSPAGDVA